MIARGHPRVLCRFMIGRLSGSFLFLRDARLALFLWRAEFGLKCVYAGSYAGVMFVLPGGG